MRTMLLLLSLMAISTQAGEPAAAIDERGKTTTSCQAKFSVSIKSSGKEYTLDGDFTGLADGRTRMRITYGSLATIIDIGISSKGSHVMFPRKSIIFNGTPEEAKDSCKEVGIIVSEMGGLRLLFPDAWDEGATGRRICKSGGRSIIHVYKKTGNSIKVTKKVILGMVEIGGVKEMAIAKVCKYDEDEKLASIVTYDAYTRRGGILCPSKVAVQFNESLQFSFAITEMDMNKEVKDDKFVFVQPEGQNLSKYPMSDMAEIGLSRLLKE